MNPQLNEEELESDTKFTYTLTEQSTDSTKSISFSTDHMNIIFNETMDFLKYIGFTDDMLDGCMSDYTKGL
jgi:hypothetical protein